MSSLLEYVAVSAYQGLVSFFSPSLGAYYNRIDPGELKITNSLAKTGQSCLLPEVFLPLTRLLQKNGDKKREMLLAFNGEESSFNGVSLSELDSFCKYSKMSEVQSAFELPEETAIVVSLLFGTVCGNQRLIKNCISCMEKLSLPVRQRVISQARPKNGLSVIHLAIIFNKTAESLKTLLGCDDLSKLVNNSRNKYLVRPLEVAVLTSASVATFKVLLAENTNVLLCDPKGNHFLSLYMCHTGIDLDFMDKILSLLEETRNRVIHAFLEQKNNQSLTLLNFSALKDKALFSLVLEMYKKHCSRLLSSEPFLENLFLSASESNSKEIVDTVRKLGESNNLILEESKIVTLAHAAAFGNHALVQSLLDAGQDVLSKTADNVSALFYAADSGDIGTVKLLVSEMKKKRKQVAQDHNAQTILREIDFVLLSSAIQALRKQNLSVAKYLVLEVFQLGLPCSKLVEIALLNHCKNRELIDLLLTTIDGVRQHLINGENILIVAAKHKNEAFFSALVEYTTFSDEVCEDSVVRNFVNSIDLDNAPPQVKQLATKCVICLEASCNTRFQPCGHIQCCKLCAHKTVRSNPRCPSCRVEIKSIVNI